MTRRPHAASTGTNGIYRSQRASVEVVLHACFLEDVPNSAAMEFPQRVVVFERWEQELRREHVTTQPPAFGLRGQSDPCDPMCVEIRFACSHWTVVFVVLRVALHGKRQTLLRVRSDMLGRVGIPEVDDGQLALPGAAADVEGDPSISFRVALDRAMCRIVVVERVRGEPDRGMEAPNHVEPRGLDSIVLKDCPKFSRSHRVPRNRPLSFLKAYL